MTARRFSGCDRLRISPSVGFGARPLSSRLPDLHISRCMPDPQPRKFTQWLTILPQVEAAYRRGN